VGLIGSRYRSGFNTSGVMSICASASAAGSHSAEKWAICALVGMGGGEGATQYEYDIHSMIYHIV
jgi:hypothetical protein